jgi:acetylornithine/N-succinyldiaminopimelate aminotransferase
MIAEPGVLEHVNHIAAYLHAQLSKLVSEFPELVLEVRGKGLMTGLKLSEEYPDLHRLIIKHKLIGVGAGKDVLRFVPPLNISEKDCDEALSKLRAACAERMAERKAILPKAIA